MELKILPYFGEKRICDIKAADIRKWQNDLIKQKYSQTYLKTINNQLSAILIMRSSIMTCQKIHAPRLVQWEREKQKEMNFWTQEEFETFVGL